MFLIFQSLMSNHNVTPELEECVMGDRWNLILFSMIALSLIVLLGNAFAQGEASESRKPFYIQLGLGYSNISYPGEMEETFDLFDNHIGGIGFDVGLYIPLSLIGNTAMNKTLVGIGGNGAIDAYYGTGILGESVSMTIDHSLFDLRAMHFFKEIGIGPFVRSDVGLSRLGVRISDLFVDLEAKSDYGFGLLLGGGIAFPISRTGTATLNVDYSFRHVEDNDYKIFCLSIGYLY